MFQKNIQIKKGLIFTLVILLFSCSSDEVGSNNSVVIEAEFKPYVQMFIDEAAKRGIAVDLNVDGIVITKREFEEGTDYVGRCTYNGNIIDIDSKYWDNTTDSFKTLLLFHELGHCFLGRGHKLDFFSNGEWASMMRGDPGIEGKSGVINFTGQRREYYINELFDENTKTPDWATASFDYASQVLQREVIFEENFIDNRNNWHINQTLEYITSIANGVYNIEVINTKGIGGASFGYQIKKIDSQENYEIEVSIMQSESLDPDIISSGIGWGSQSPFVFYDFQFSKNGRIQLGDYYTNTFVFDQPSNFIKEGFNKITIRKIEDTFYFLSTNSFFIIPIIFKTLFKISLSLVVTIQKHK